MRINIHIEPNENCDSLTLASAIIKVCSDGYEFSAVKVAKAILLEVECDQNAR